MRALAQLFDLNLRTELARLAQMVENQVVGAPCWPDGPIGVVPRPARPFAPHPVPARFAAGAVSLPPGIRFVGLDSGIRHAVTGASYGDVRTAAFMGLRIIERELGARSAAISAN